MNKQILWVGLSGFLMSVSASASAKYLYFVANEGQASVSQVATVFNLNMDPLYSSILGKKVTLACDYKNSKGDVQSLEFESSECGGGPLFGLRLSTKTDSGKQISSSIMSLYVEHRSVMLTGSIGGEEADGLDFSVMSATQYQSLVKLGNGGGGPILPSIDQVRSVSRNDRLSSEALAPGAMNCRLEHRQPFCVDGR